jgi:hypothetical protein
MSGRGRARQHRGHEASGNCDVSSGSIDGDALALGSNATDSPSLATRIVRLGSSSSGMMGTVSETREIQGFEVDR